MHSSIPQDRCAQSSCMTVTALMAQAPESCLQNPHKNIREFSWEASPIILLGFSPHVLETYGASNGFVHLSCPSQKQLCLKGVNMGHEPTISQSPRTAPKVIFLFDYFRPWCVRHFPSCCGDSALLVPHSFVTCHTEGTDEVLPAIAH